jgi:hypothetical protein
VGGLTGVRDPDGGWRFRVERTAPIHGLLAAVGADARIRDVRVEEAGLESVVRGLYAERAAR